jgi:hypothetical protein
MRLTAKTRALAAIAAVLAVLVGFASRPQDGPAALPTVQGVAPDDVQRLVLATALDRLVLERASADKASPDHGRWRIVAPLQADADTELVRTALRQLGGGVRMTASMGEGDPKPFGLDTEGALDVQLYTTTAPDAAPALGLVVGRDAGGGATFVRIPSDAAVYRADIGGRARFARSAAEWRDRAVIAVDPVTVTGLDVVVSGRPSMIFRRGPSAGVDEDGDPTPGAWTLEGAPFRADAAAVDGLVRTLARMRAGEIHNPTYAAGLDAPAGTVTLRLQDGRTHEIIVGSRLDEGATFLRVDGRPDVYRVAGTVGRQILQPPEAFRDRTIFAFAPDDVASLSLVEGGLTIVLEQSADGAGAWTVAQPANMDVDQEQARQLLAGLSSLRAAALPAADAFQPSGAALTVRFRDGRAASLELGPSERTAVGESVVRARSTVKSESDGRGGVFLVDAAVISGIRRAFGRG